MRIYLSEYFWEQTLYTSFVIVLVFQFMLYMLNVDRE